MRWKEMGETSEGGSVQGWRCLHVFFFNDTATTEIYTLSLHDALPICPPSKLAGPPTASGVRATFRRGRADRRRWRRRERSEEHTSELQSRQYLVCRLLLEKKKLSQACAWTTTTDVLLLNLFNQCQLCS